MSKGNFIHGQSASRLYTIWCALKRRCNNKNGEQYKDYGGRGVTVCDEWRSFEPFRDWAMANGYRDDLTIDRKDNNGNYCPENCQWVSRKEQANNRRNTIKIEFDGMSKTLSEWSEIVGIPYLTIWKRVYQRGWPIEKALKTPLQNNGYLIKKGE